MNDHQDRRQRDLHLEKLGIRQIHERIEVSPIITDPGTLGLNLVDGGTKSYVCTIHFQEPPITKYDIG